MKQKLRSVLLAVLIVFCFISIIKYFNNRLEESEESLSYKRQRPAAVINLNELFHFGSCLLNEAGKRIVQIRQNAELDLKRKKDESIVTRADLESHTIIVHTLEQKFEGLEIHSEENFAKSARFDSEHFLSLCNNYEKKLSDLYAPLSNIQVWIDPLDATQEYSENLVDYVTVMFCIVDQNEPKAGIIHNPFKKMSVSSFYTKAKPSHTGENSTKNRIIISRSHAGSINATIEQKFKHQNPRIISAAGSGFKTLSLLENRADLYLHTSKIYKWDICAPNAILNNYGGKLTARNGQMIDYSNTNKDSLSVDGIIATLFNYEYFFDIFKKV